MALSERISDERLAQYAGEDTCEAHDEGVRCGVYDGILMARELREARALIARMLEALKDVQWSPNGWCPQCDCRPHLEKCILAGAIAAAEQFRKGR